MAVRPILRLGNPILRQRVALGLRLTVHLHFEIDPLFY